MITERTNEQGLTFLDIETEHCSACLCTQGAHIISWIPQGHEECLFTSSESRYEPGVAIRGGIPICWPWFGKKEGAPSHGIARTTPWLIDHYGVNPADGVATVHLRLYPEDHKLPIAFLRITLAEELRMRLHTTCRKGDLQLTKAFHNYLKVGEAANCKIHGFNHYPYEEFGVEYEASGQKKTPLPVRGGMDRIYKSREPIPSATLEDPVLKRKIIIEAENTYSGVVWNPGAEISKDMPDLHDDEWKQFVCIEPAITSHNAVRLSPGHTHIMRQTIKVQHIV